MAMSVSEIKAAIAQGEIHAYYQPQYDATTGRIVSAEALARWIRPDGSLVQPMDFVPVLEKTNDINDLDWHMADLVCGTLRELGDSVIPIAVNFSRWHVHEKDFAVRLTDLLRSYDIPAKLFEVEITESALVNEESRILDWINQVRDFRIRVAIDDFGSGLSSLQFVKDMPIDVLKIDRSLLSGNCEGEKERIVLESIFYFANRLNLDTIAEGVETNEQLGFLKTCDCKKIQGYLFAKPMPKETFMELCRVGAGAKAEGVDILELQTPASATQLLLSAIFMRYPLVIFANLTRNSYYMMAYDNFTATSCPSTGNFDELIIHGAATMHEEDRESFRETFGRENLLRLHAAGRDRIALISRQVGNDGVYRRVETTDYFVKSPSSDDVLVISLNNNIDDR